MFENRNRRDIQEDHFPLNCKNHLIRMLLTYFAESPTDNLDRDSRKLEREKENQPLPDNCNEDRQGRPQKKKKSI